MSRYKQRKEYAHLSDEEILAVLLLCDERASKEKRFFELHPGEKELVEQFLRKPKKLKRFLRGIEEHRPEMLSRIIKLLNRPVGDP